MDIPNFQVFTVQRTDSRAIVPKKATPNSAGFDLYCIESLILKSGERCIINLGLKMSIPEGYYGRIAPRSGLALKYGIDVMGGVIDNDYRGEVKVILINHGSEDFKIQAKDRIAQIILEKYYTEKFIGVIKSSSLSKTKRGNRGFGSTGI